MKTKIRFINEGFENDWNRGDVGYIDGYVATSEKNIKACYVATSGKNIKACVITGSKLVYANNTDFEVITEEDFLKEDQNTRIFVTQKK